MDIEGPPYCGLVPSLLKTFNVMSKFHGADGKLP